jgi:hypothetical protein
MRTWHLTQRVSITKINRLRLFKIKIIFILRIVRNIQINSVGKKQTWLLKQVVHNVTLINVRVIYQQVTSCPKSVDKAENQSLVQTCLLLWSQIARRRIVLFDSRSSVSIVSDYRLGDRGSISGKGNGFFFYAEHSHPFSAEAKNEQKLYFLSLWCLHGCSGTALISPYTSW